MRIAIFQPMIPHYRTEFFERLRNKVDQIALYTYDSTQNSKKEGFYIGMESEHIINIEKRGLLLYSPWKLLSRKYDTLVLMLHQGHITTWLLLLTKWLHGKKIIVWGQGISVKRYVKEEKHLSPWIKAQIRMADAAWIYMEKEAGMWRKVFPKKPIVALNNSVSGITKMLDYRVQDKATIKETYGIKQEIVFVFCARFGSPFRRIDLMEEMMAKLDNRRFGFIIIGGGKGKPDFSKYTNVYDFGAVYDDEVKKLLFSVSDMYLQPGWIGLSVVEAMAYGLPVCTFNRKGNEIRHGVEFGILRNGENALLFDSMDEALEIIGNLSLDKVKELGANAREYIRTNHTPEIMVENAMKVLQIIK